LSNSYGYLVVACDHAIFCGAACLAGFRKNGRIQKFIDPGLARASGMRQLSGVGLFHDGPTLTTGNLGLRDRDGPPRSQARSPVAAGTKPVEGNGVVLAAPQGHVAAEHPSANNVEIRLTSRHRLQFRPSRLFSTGSGTSVADGRNCGLSYQMPRWRSNNSCRSRAWLYFGFFTLNQESGRASGL
jgi:hypothetical protein